MVTNILHYEITAGILGTAAVVILVVALALNQASKNQNAGRLAFQTYSGPTLGTPGTDEGTPTHIDPSTQWTYKSYPPTNGPHYSVTGSAPAPWGTVDNLVEGQFVHNLEHGGIVILYAADLTTPQVDQLRSLVRQLQTAGFAKIVLEPWPDMPKDSKVILTAWNWIMKLPGIDAVSIVKFTKAHHASPESPEPTVQ